MPSAPGAVLDLEVMDQMLHSFCALAARLSAALAVQGHCCVAINPLTGLPMAYTRVGSSGGAVAGAPVGEPSGAMSGGAEGSAEGAALAAPSCKQKVQKQKQLWSSSPLPVPSESASALGQHPAEWGMAGGVWVHVGSSSGERYSEVRGAACLLQLPVQEGVCPLLDHPYHGTSVYPATLFTSAPLEGVRALLQSLSSEAC